VGLFRLILRDKNNLDRPLLYDPITSVMKWEDSGEELDISRLRIKPTTKSQESFHAAHQLSPDAPAGKSKSLILVKIQLGFRCNFSCQYCSQSTQRYDSPELIDIKKAQQFNEKLSSWYDGGSDGKGNGTRFEFWGGETLLYWRHIKIIAPYLREKYPNVVLRLFTNGSIMNDEIIDLAEKWQIQIVVSHDGPESAKVRGKDPFQDPHKKARLVAMYSRLGPKRLTSFNCTLTSSNYSLNKIRNYLAEQVGIQPHQVPLNHELSIPYQDDNFRFVWTDPKQAQLVRNEVFNELTARGPLGYERRWSPSEGSRLF
jgi:uncharacterized protein